MPANESSSAAFDPVRTYVHLTDDGEGATPIPVTDDFWQTIETRSRLHEGRLLTAYHFQAGRWDHWERHPAGDEVVCLLAGAMDLVLEAGDGDERVVELRGRSACIVPRGAWHRGIVRAPSDALFVTPGKGTQHRPLSKGDHT